MQQADVSWLVSARLRRVKSALRGGIVEAKLRWLERGLKANFDPNQPRVPAGNPDGGEWTGTGGGTSDVRIAQMAPRGGRRRGSDAGATPGQQARLEVTRAQARAKIRLVNEIDPNWKPQASLTRPNSIEGQTARAEAEIREAEARLRELAREPAESLIDAYRRQQGLDLFGRPIWSRERNTVAVSKVGETPFVGTNSELSAYSSADRAAAEGLRATLIEKHPDVMNTDNIGQFPNDSLFHAEVTSLLRAARANGGTLEGKTVEMTVDRVMCSSCEKVLPLVSSELGNPTIRFVDNVGNIAILRNGKWDE